MYYNEFSGKEGFLRRKKELKKTFYEMAELVEDHRKIVEKSIYKMQNNLFQKLIN